jgi:hypothetical protein
LASLLAQRSLSTFLSVAVVVAVMATWHLVLVAVQGLST